MSVLIVDYGMGNLASVKRAFEECGSPVFISDDPADINSATKIVLPGVGSFDLAVKNMKSTGWFDALKEAATIKQIPLLGICLGMQLLADKGEEHGQSEGLGLIPGEVLKLDVSPLRTPHVGWNEIKQTNDCDILNNLEDGTDFYFVHSYHFKTNTPDHSIAVTPYGDDFTSIVANENVWGTQFHPEKSGLAGFQILRNFIGMS